MKKILNKVFVPNKIIGFFLFNLKEVRQINDCLATILKLTAKYKL